jgi:hypothetical protein
MKTKQVNTSDEKAQIQKKWRTASHTCTVFVPVGISFMAWFFQFSTGF